MPTEYEAKFLDINTKDIRSKLLNMGATLVHKKAKYFRYIYYLCTKNIRGFFRIRDESGKIFITVKKYSPDKEFPEEYELSINNSFNTAVQFADALGLDKKAYQESYREKWSHSLAHEITIDTMPGLLPYLEIDCESQEKLDKLIKILNLDLTKKRTGPYGKTYEEYYGIPEDELNNNTKSLTFKNILEEINPRKNIDLLKQLANKQKGLGQPNFKTKYHKYKKQYLKLKNKY